MSKSLEASLLGEDLKTDWEREKVAGRRTCNPVGNQDQYVTWLRAEGLVGEKGPDGRAGAGRGRRASDPMGVGAGRATGRGNSLETRM